MAHPVVGTKYPPDIFNDLDDDEDRDIKKVFHAVFDPLEPLDLDSAAKQIDTNIPIYNEEQYQKLQRLYDAGEESTLRNPGNTVWWILSDFFVPLAKQLSFDHASAQERLVDLLRTLCFLPVKPLWSRPFAGENPWTVSNFADLGNTVQYEYHGALFARASEDPLNVPAQQEARNFNAWTARLHVRCIGNHSLYALWCIRSALEEDEVKLGAALEYRIPRAADWIEIAGPELPTHDLEDTSSAYAGKPWYGKPGFSEERWLFWKTRFLLMAGMSSLTQTTRDNAAAAARKIVWISVANGTQQH